MIINTKQASELELELELEVELEFDSQNSFPASTNDNDNNELNNIDSSGDDSYNQKYPQLSIKVLPPPSLYLHDIPTTSRSSSTISALTTTPKLGSSNFVNSENANIDDNNSFIYNETLDLDHHNVVGRSRSCCHKDDQ